MFGSGLYVRSKITCSSRFLIDFCYSGESSFNGFYRTARIRFTEIEVKSPWGYQCFFMNNMPGSLIIKRPHALVLHNLIAVNTKPDHILTIFYFDSSLFYKILKFRLIVGK